MDTCPACISFSRILPRNRKMQCQEATRTCLTQAGASVSNTFWHPVLSGHGRSETTDYGWMDGRMDEWTDGRMDGWTDGWMDGLMDGWTDGWMDGQMDGWNDGWMDGWMNG